MLICRNYKGDVDMAEIDHFMPLLMQHEEEGLLCPVLSHGNVHFMWIKYSNLYRILVPTSHSSVSVGTQLGRVCQLDIRAKIKIKRDRM